MTDPRPGHGRFDELAAGYALHSLDPGDQELFARHARQCARCQRSIADYADVAAAIADLAPAAEPSPQLAARIMAAAASDLTSGQQPAPLREAAATPDETQNRAAGRPRARVLALHRHRSRLVKAAAAAAAAVIVGGGIWGGLAATGGGPARPTLADCVQAHQCAEVVLTASATHRTAARVIIRDGVVWMEPAAMGANPGGEIYVLWQLTGAHTPLAVGSFDVRPGAQAPVRVGGLAAPYRSTWAFAVSLEHGRTIPATPSHPVALGQVSA